MSKFDAGTAVEAMEFDFTAYGGRAGTIPEPSNERFQKFIDRVRKMGEKAGLTKADATPAEVASTLANASEKDTSGIVEEIDEAMANLCQNTPNVVEIGALPFRVKMAFNGWLVGQFRPEGGTPGTKP